MTTLVEKVESAVFSLAISSMMAISTVSPVDAAPDRTALPLFSQPSAPSIGYALPAIPDKSPATPLPAYLTDNPAIYRREDDILSDPLASPDIRGQKSSSNGHNKYDLRTSLYHRKHH